MSKRAKRFVVACFLTFLSFAIVFLLSLTGVTTSFEYKTYDLRFRHRGPQEVNPDIVLIGIDDFTKEKLEWENGRKWHFGILNNSLRFTPPKVIGFDIEFKGETTRGSPPEENWDELLAYACTLFDKKVCAAYHFILREDDPNVRKVTPELLDRLEPFALSNVRGDTSKVLTGIYAILPYDRLSSVTDLGFINAPEDMDGVIRRLPLIFGLKYKDARTNKIVTKFYPSLSLIMVCSYRDVPIHAIEVNIGKWIKIPVKNNPIIIPIDEKGNMTINFAWDFSKFENMSFVHILEIGDKKNYERLKNLKGKMVFVAESSTGSVDVGPIPVVKKTPLVSTHMNAVNNILEGNFLKLTPLFLQYAIVFGLCFGVGTLNATIRPVRSVISSVVILLLYIFLSYYLFFKHSIMIPLVSPTLGVVLVFSSVIFYRYMTEEKQKLWIKKVLGQYLPPNVMKEVLEAPDKLKLGGERKNLTVLFSDIRGFTSYCENKRPEEIVQVLNEHMDRMTDAIFKYSGTLDKYVGDEIVAFFGAPGTEHSQDHAKMAVLAALKMKIELDRLKEKWKSEGKELLDFGVGINTGEMLVGNMGSTDVFDYTVIGDEVNIGSRIQALTRNYGVTIIITESTYNLVKDIVEARELGTEQVRGRAAPIKIFEVTSLKKTSTNSKD